MYNYIADCPKSLATQLVLLNLGQHVHAFYELFAYLFDDVVLLRLLQKRHVLHVEILTSTQSSRRYALLRLLALGLIDDRR